MVSEQPYKRDKIAQVYLGQWGDEETKKKTRGRINWFANQIEHSSVLDIGCSEGILPVLLGRKGIDVTGIDINPDAIDYANQLLAAEDPAVSTHVTFLCADFINNDWNGKKFEYVVLGEVIEHFAHPEVLINKALGLLKSDGTMLITTPFGYFPDTYHKSTFTLTSFLKYFRTAGITPETLNVEHGYIRFVAKNKPDATNQWSRIDKSILELNENSIINEQKLFYDRLSVFQNARQDLLVEKNQLTTAINQLQVNIAELEESFQALSAKHSRLDEIYRNLVVKYSQQEGTFRTLYSKYDQQAEAYRILSSKYQIATNKISYQVSVEVSKAFSPMGLNTLKLPYRLLKLFVRWLKKKPAICRIIVRTKKILSKVLPKQTILFDSNPQESTFVKSLELFIQKTNSNLDQPVVVISGTTKRMGGLKRLNRPMAFANELAKMNIPVMYVYYRWQAKDDSDSDYDGAYLLQFPNDLFHKMAHFIAKNITNKRKLFLISIPDAPSVSELESFRVNGWKVGYEVRDEWSEFDKAGVGNWYDSTYEIYLSNNADFVTSVSIRLHEKMVGLGADTEKTIVIPNGLNEEFLEKAKPAFEKRKAGYRGNGVIGYFGHLTEKWFNWDLLLETATQNPQLNFEIIGFGAPVGLHLPSNIKLLGEKTHNEIIEIAKNWSLTIIPFKNNELSRAVDPIKLYEYQALGLVCVSCGMDQIEGYPFTFIYKKDKDFKQTLEAALNFAPSQSDWELLQNFVLNNTWKDRVIRTLEIAGIEKLSS